MGSVLAYGCEAWPLRVEDMRRLLLIVDRCLLSTDGIWWIFARNSKARDKVLGLKIQSLEQGLIQDKLR